jgi:hypothetical protein
MNAGPSNAFKASHPGPQSGSSGAPLANTRSLQYCKITTFHADISILCISYNDLASYSSSYLVVVANVSRDQ